MNSKPFAEPSSRRERKVLLALRDNHLAPRLLASAVSLCQRMEAGLDILCCADSDELSADARALLGNLKEENVTCSLTFGRQWHPRDIVRYANTHECVVTVVIDSLQAWERVAEDRAANAWLKLACPLVTAVPLK